MRIGELAQMAGVSVTTIRYYEDIGILPPAERLDNGYRTYSETDVERLRFVHRARTLDFSLDEIAEILGLRDEGKAPCAFVMGQVDVKLSEVDHKIKDLNRLKADLQQLKLAAKKLPAEERDAQSCICHIIENQNLSEDVRSK